MSSTVSLDTLDILVHRGRSVLRLPIEERRQLVADALRKVDYPVILSTPFDVKPVDLVRAAKEWSLKVLSPSAKARRMTKTEPAMRSRLR